MQENQSTNDKDDSSFQLFVAAESATALYMIEASKNEWLLDSGASNHMTAHHDLFMTYETFKDETVEINLGNDSKIHALGKGSIEMKLTVNEKTITGTLTDVLHVPEISRNLFSIGKALLQGLMLQFQPDATTFYKNNKPVMTVKR